MKQPKSESEMTDAEFKRWLKRHKITGTAAAFASARRRLAIFAKESK